MKKPKNDIKKPAIEVETDHIKDKSLGKKEINNDDIFDLPLSKSSNYQSDDSDDENEDQEDNDDCAVIASTDLERFLNLSDSCIELCN